MTDALALLWPAFVVAVCLVGIHTYFGIEVPVYLGISVKPDVDVQARFEVSDE